MEGRPVHEAATRPHGAGGAHGREGGSGTDVLHARPRPAVLLDGGVEVDLADVDLAAARRALQVGYVGGTLNRVATSIREGCGQTIELFFCSSGDILANYLVFYFR